MRVWIFQANLNQYRVLESLRLEKEELWNLRQHAKDVQVGDRVLIWISGKLAGIYALGTVCTDAVIRPDSVSGISYWISKRDGQRPMARVLVHYDKIFTDKPLLKTFIQCDPALWNLKILLSPRGTNFTVSEEEWLAIQGWLAL